LKNILFSFLNGKISECPPIWNANIEIQSRHGHDLLLQCLHQAATCKTLADEVLPILKSTIQHYTLVSVTQQTGTKKLLLKKNFLMIMLIY
jgi:hypothetical protein